MPDGGEEISLFIIRDQLEEIKRKIDELNGRLEALLAALAERQEEST